jgi:hypothetical protein
MTSALNGGDEWSASRPGRALPLRKDSLYPLDRRLGGPQSLSEHRGYRKNPFAFAGDRTSIETRRYPAQSDSCGSFSTVVSE